MHNIHPLFAIDFYKAGHLYQYPPGTSLVYSNFTPRQSRIEGVNEMVFFGLQYILKEYLSRFNQIDDSLIGKYSSLMDDALGEGVVTNDHIRKLQKKGYLPIHIKALPEGTKVPMGTPAFTIYNTDPDFFWLTNYLETLLSCLIWKPCTTATTAHQFRKLFDRYADMTGANKEMVQWQGHDFSMRGMSGLEDACLSGAAHLLSFSGTDTLPAINFVEIYYNADGFVGGSVPATEHSVMCAGGKESELETLNRLLDTYPTGILSIVSDTWDFWKLVTEYLPILKDRIIKRAENSPGSKIVIRPDSGVPHKIINGDENAAAGTPEQLGLIRCLEYIFGSSVNDKGYKELNPCIGAIYGDSINLVEAETILEGLKNNGFVSTSIVMGLGSFAYQYVTRDTYGTVCKATYCEVNGEPRAIFKEPKTGAWKKSHQGLLRVNDDLTVTQNVSWAEEKTGLLETVFLNGKITKEYSLNEIRDRLNK